MEVLYTENIREWDKTESVVFTYTCSLFEYVIVGPDKWEEEFPVANGPRQSPINIVPKEAQYDSSLKPLKLKYDPSNAKGILNNGHSFQVDFLDDTDSSSKHSLAPSVRTQSNLLICSCTPVISVVLVLLFFLYYIIL